MGHCPSTLDVNNLGSWAHLSVCFLLGKELGFACCEPGAKGVLEYADAHGKLAEGHALIAPSSSTSVNPRVCFCCCFLISLSPLYPARMTDFLGRITMDLQQSCLWLHPAQA